MVFRQNPLLIPILHSISTLFPFFSYYYVLYLRCRVFIFWVNNYLDALMQSMQLA